MAARPLQAVYYGLMKYQTAFRLQEHLCSKHREAIQQNEPAPNTLMILQHTPVYTIGIRNHDPANDYSETAARRFRDLGADFIRSTRGGLITFHGPGQLVAYPILNLRSEGFQASTKWYVKNLETCIISTCGEFDVECGSTCDVGVWVGNSKIAAIGVRSSGSITSHGLALNCNTDLKWFSHIVPCGLVDKTVTSLSHQVSRDVTVEETLPHFLASFSKTFNQELKFHDISHYSEEEKQSFLTETL